MRLGLLEDDDPYLRCDKEREEKNPEQLMVQYSNDLILKREEEKTERERMGAPCTAQYNPIILLQSPLSIFPFQHCP